MLYRRNGVKNGRGACRLYMYVEVSGLLYGKREGGGVDEQDVYMYSKEVTGEWKDAHIVYIYSK